MTTLEPSGEKSRSRTANPARPGNRQRIDAWPESKSYRATESFSAAFVLEVAARRLRTGEKATCPAGTSLPSVRVRIHRRPGTSHKSIRPLLQPTARRVPFGEKLTEDPPTGPLVSVTSAVLRVSCQR